METDPIIPIFALKIFVILIIGLILRKFKQSNVVAYLLSGFLLGPYMLGLFKEVETMTRLGEFGVVFLLCFVGMEISPKKLSENWIISIFGTLLQIALSVFLVMIIGSYFDWSFPQVILLGFVISLSSTAVILKLLRDWNEMDTNVGRNVLGILLIQDILIIPMLISLGFMGGSDPSMQTIILQIIGAVILFSIVIWITWKGEIRIPFLKHIRQDQELEIFGALSICFGSALLSSFLGLSAPLGAFVGGIIVGAARETERIRQHLVSIGTVFIALFFASIGMLLDIQYIGEHIWGRTSNIIQR